jgi:hypothetical protein
MMLGIDHSGGVTDATAIARAGYRFVARYLWGNAPKGLSAAECDALHAAGLGIVALWESTAGRAADGAAAGQADAGQALLYADLLDMPTDVPIYFAIDADLDYATVAPYFTLVHLTCAQHGQPVGAYGGGHVLDQLHDAGLIEYGMIAAATSWSHGVTPAWCQLRQIVGTTLPPIDGTTPGAYDEDQALTDQFGSWWPTLTMEDTTMVIYVSDGPSTGRWAWGPPYDLISLGQPAAAAGDVPMSGATFADLVADVTAIRTRFGVPPLGTPATPIGATATSGDLATLTTAVADGVAAGIEQVLAPLLPILATPSGKKATP